MPQRIDTVVALTNRETQELQGCEAVIERGLKVFFEVGKALLTIRDRQLYRATHSTFDDYCLERWQISRPRAYQLIGAAGAAENLSTMVDIPKPSNERQLRPLTSLEPEEQRSAWTQAVAESDGGQPTAAKVEEVVRVHTRGKSRLSPPLIGLNISELALTSPIRPETVNQVRAALSQILHLLPELTRKERALLDRELRRFYSELASFYEEFEVWEFQRRATERLDKELDRASRRRERRLAKKQSSARPDRQSAGRS